MPPIGVPEQHRVLSLHEKRSSYKYRARTDRATVALKIEVLDTIKNENSSAEVAKTYGNTESMNLRRRKRNFV